MGLFTALFRKRDHAWATRQELKALQSGDERAVLDVARSLVHEGREERAFNLLREGMSRLPSTPAVQEMLESIERMITWKAIKRTQATLANENSAATRILLSEMCRRVGDHKSALLHGREAIQIDPNDARAYSALAQVYLDQFRITRGSIEGMNALRCLLKAHSLSPAESLHLVNLAELFVILEAPLAAAKFLQPVQRAFQSDPKVLELASSIGSLAPEGTSQIQDLFLMRERKQDEAGATTPGSHDRVSAQLQQDLASLTATLPQAECVCIVNASRGLAWSRPGSATPGAGQVENLGALADTARQISTRMGLGRVHRVQIRNGEQSGFVGILTKELAYVHVAGKQQKQETMEGVFERVRNRVLRDGAGRLQ